jgi:hypothetical protein
MVTSINSRTSKTVPITRLKPYPNNPHTYPPKLLRKLERLIEGHGQIPPILVSSDMTIISGEEWWLALKKAGRTEAHVVVLADLSPAEAATARLALARLPLDTKLDRSRLKAELDTLQAGGIDLRLTGYDQAEIDFTFEIDMPYLDVTQNVNATPKRQGPAVSRFGDIFDLGGAHRLGCGDACDWDFIDLICGGRESRLCIADPPFGLSAPGFGERQRQHGYSGAGEMTANEFGSFVTAALEALRYASAPQALIYMFMDPRRTFEVTVAGKYLALPLLDTAVWCKPNGEAGGLSVHKLCAVFGADSEAIHLKPEKFVRKPTSVWNYASPDDDPTAKPVAMLADIIRDCTKRGQLVLDPFIGQGETLIAAEKTGRGCVGVERDPYGLDVAIRRWQAFTGKDAIHLRTGERFDDIAHNLLTHQEG